MKILITGAAGGIGSLLSQKLHLENHDLYLVDDLSGGSLENLQRLNFPFELHNKDVSRPELISEIFANFQPDLVLHLASVTALADCQSNPYSAFQSNFISTLLLLEKCREHGIKRFVLASTSAVYENSKSNVQFESDQIEPHLVYPMTKAFAEKACKSYSDVYNIPISVLRLFNVYGPYQNTFRKTPPLLNYLCREYLDNRRPVLHSNGEQRRDYISVHDVVAAFLSIVERVNELSNYDIFNVCSGEQTSVNEIDAIVRAELKVNLSPNYRKAEDIWAAYPELKNAVFPIPSSIIQAEVDKNSLGDNSSARNLLNFTPTSTETGIRRVIQEIKKLNSL